MSVFGTFFKISNILNLSFFVYLLTFLILLKIRSFEISKTWIVPVFALYFGLMFSTLFALFLNGEDSTFLPATDSVFTLIPEILNPMNGKGKVLYGGYFGSIIGILIVSFLVGYKQKTFATMLDISAISISFLFSVWRIGCFVGGCCYGRPASFGFSFPDGTDAFRHLRDTSLVVGDATVTLLPTQLVSSAGDFVIFLFLLILFCAKKTKYPYFYFFAHAFLYGAGRFTIEFFRIDPREFWGPLSMSQWISLALVAAGLVFFVKNRKEIADFFKNKASHIR